MYVQPSWVRCLGLTDGLNQLLNTYTLVIWFALTFTLCMQCISVHSIQGKATQSSKVARGPVIELCCVLRPGAVYPTAKASYMYVYGMYSAIQLERFGHMHTLHMLCNKRF